MPKKESNTRAAAARRLAQIVAYSGLSKTDFAKQLNISSPNLSNWLAGSNMPGVEGMLRVKDRWHISLDWIYSGDGKGQTLKLTEQLEAMNIEEPSARRAGLKVIQGTKHPRAQRA